MRTVQIKFTVDRPGEGNVDPILDIPVADLNVANIQVIGSGLQGVAGNFPNEVPETRYSLEATIQDGESDESLVITGKNVKKSTIEDVIATINQAFNPGQNGGGEVEDTTTTSTETTEQTTEAVETTTETTQEEVTEVTTETETTTETTEPVEEETTTTTEVFNPNGGEITEVQ